MTPTAAFWLTKQAVFCGIAIVRRHFDGRYRHYDVYVGREDTILPIRASWQMGGKGFVFPLLPVSRIAVENAFRNAAAHAAHINPRISNVRGQEAKCDLEGPPW
jgi:hypothetical protein